MKEELESEKRRLKFINIELPSPIRYRERSASSLFNGRLKDEFGGRHGSKRGHAKVFSHLMFCILVITVEQLMRFVT